MLSCAVFAPCKNVIYSQQKHLALFNSTAYDDYTDHLAEKVFMNLNVQLLRQLRLDKRLTQSDVAAAMGISTALYSLVERGERPRSIDEAIRTISGMRRRTDRTDGGDLKTGRKKAKRSVAFADVKSR